MIDCEPRIYAECSVFYTKYENCTYMITYLYPDISDRMFAFSQINMIERRKVQSRTFTLFKEGTWIKSKILLHKWKLLYAFYLIQHIKTHLQKFRKWTSCLHKPVFIMKTSHSCARDVTHRLDGNTVYIWILGRVANDPSVVKSRKRPSPDLYHLLTLSLWKHYDTTYEDTMRNGC